MEENNQPEIPVAEELEDLKQRADLLGVKYSAKIGVDALRAKIEEKLAEKPEEGEDVSPDHIVDVNKSKEALKLIRCRITNRDPSKNGIQGTVISCASPNTGIVKKWIPFHGFDDGYHVPQIIFDFLKTKKYLHVWTEPDPVHKGNVITKQAWEDEYVVEVLPPLTKEELEELAREQKATGMV